MKVGILYGKPFNPHTAFRESHLLRDCPTCGARKGSRCHNKWGVALERTSHRARGEKRSSNHGLVVTR